jgi:hypothetical protein
MYPALFAACLGWLASLAAGQSYKIETMGMIIHNGTEKTTIDHQRPVTNVRGVVRSHHPGKLQHRAARHHR